MLPVAVVNMLFCTCMPFGFVRYQTACNSNSSFFFQFLFILFLSSGKSIVVQSRVYKGENGYFGKSLKNQTSRFITSAYQVVDNSKYR